MTSTTDAVAATTPAVTSASIYTGSTTATTSPSDQQYNSQLFLKLLTTQLANQDPSSPMDSASMVEQTSQLASMEQLTSINTTTTSTYQTQMQATATAMLGKTVTWADSDGTPESGTVSSIAFSSTGSPQLTIGSSTVGLDAITGVTAADPSSTSTSSTSS